MHSKAEALRAAGGRVLSDDDRLALRELSLPAGLLEVLSNIPVLGVSFSVPPEADASGLGVEMRWMGPDEMLSEAVDAYPGIVAVRAGYVPVGDCLEGSGDPYFYRGSDGAIVRVPHDAATDDVLDTTRIELVTASVSAFLDVAEIEA